MDLENFKVEYEVDDGYVGKSAPLYTSINEGDIEDDMDESELDFLYDDYIEEAFRQNVSAYGKNRDEFLAWAKQVIELRHNYEEESNPL